MAENVEKRYVFSNLQNLAEVQKNWEDNLHKLCNLFNLNTFFVMGR